ncbi:STE3-like pheromone receptor [Artomyces pyxidatus]|uniref:STE3-like pheromone receptor n=1 Tax=Artomyces pyxidatus TaxID=48021 RepID=A0ACB8TB92_9AGAM|nr:STE3-like pheromone receptor [Artomyces pyxidatus]
MSSNAAFSAFAFLGFVVSAVPIYWHIEVANAGTCLFLFWTALGCFVGFINSLVWNNNTRNSAPVWCDISGRLLLAVSVALPAATLCITRRLYAITSLSVIAPRRQLTTDLLLGFGIPGLQTILVYVVQTNRFDIYEEFGCFIPISNNILAYVLIYSLPLILGTVSGYFGITSLYRFIRGRREVDRLVETVNSLNRSWYIRLVTLACADVVATVPLASYQTYTWARSATYRTWIPWNEVHNNFSHVGQFPSEFWKSHPAYSTPLELMRWMDVVAALSFFLVFGTSSEAVRHYRMVLRYLASKMRTLR